MDGYLKKGGSSMEQAMRCVDKRSWVCTNTEGRCPFSEKMSADLNEEVPADKRCPLCESDITILSEAPKTIVTQGIIEIIPFWQCKVCGKSKTLETGEDAPRRCPDCGGEALAPLIKKGGPYDSDSMKKY